MYIFIFKSNKLRLISLINLNLCIQLVRLEIRLLILYVVKQRKNKKTCKLNNCGGRFVIIYLKERLIDFLKMYMIMK